MRRNGWTAVALMVGVLGLTACPAQDAPPAEQPAETPAPAPAEPMAGPPAALPEGVTQEMVAAGQQVYAQANCFTCHGQDGRGTALGPNMVNGTWIHVDAAQPLMPQLEAIIRTGVTQPREYPAPMPPMGGVQLSDEQVRNLAGYVASLVVGQ